MKKCNLRFIWIVMIVSAVCLLVNACHKRVFPVFKIENMLFCIPNEIEKQSGEMDSENKSMYQGLQYRYLGVIQKDTNLPYFLLNNYEACDIPEMTKIYTINIEQAESLNLSYYGLLLETADGSVYFAYPYIQNADDADANLLKEQIISLFYSEQGNIVE